MFNRIWRASANDASLYDELKSDVQAGESWVVILVAFAIAAVITSITSSFVDGVISFAIQIIGYLLMAFWAWLVGAVIGKGEGSFGEVQKALAYPYALPAVLMAIPVIWLGIIVVLWFLVTMSTAIRETLGIGKGLTFFIVVSAMAISFGLLVVGPAAVAVFLSQALG
ncbi:hypothetical protein D6779_08845 [Candidatus Parcubacteria bacterium]|nr:MAG: hypothetical protein D6779_08845 [Candidatus Parcubacteria bacterium]